MEPPQGAFRLPPTAAGFEITGAGAAAGSLGIDMPGLPAEAPPPGASGVNVNLPPGVAGPKELMDRYRAGLSELIEDE